MAWWVFCPQSTRVSHGIDRPWRVDLGYDFEFCSTENTHLAGAQSPGSIGVPGHITTHLRFSGTVARAPQTFTTLMW